MTFKSGKNAAREGESLQQEQTVQGKDVANVGMTKVGMQVELEGGTFERT